MATETAERDTAPAVDIGSPAAEPHDIQPAAGAGAPPKPTLAGATATPG